MSPRVNRDRAIVTSSFTGSTYTRRVPSKLAVASLVPSGLKAQLVDRGRLVIPVGPQGHQDLMLVKRVGERLEETVLEGCVFVPLIGEEGWAG